MVFNSLTFAVFLPAVFFLYWFVFNRSLRLQNAFVLVVSYIFYGWWDWRFLILIAITSFCSWWSGLLIERCRDIFGGGVNPYFRRLPYIVSAANIVLNLLLLCVFKYYNFFVDSFVALFASLGITLHVKTLQIILPVGISFYTFQALSYSIDVYKQKIKPTRNIVEFFAFISFFPQLVAGPIERATNLLPQFQRPRTFNYAQASDGCRQMLWGFFKKICVADCCAVYVNKIFDTWQDQSGATLLLAAVFFAFQIYGDFSGYSDIAIGCAKLFGINLMRNFNVPYFSRDIAEFWRRWHISLTTWFRDYIYFPLGGSRTAKAKIIRNTFIVFMVSGLWHGANWTYVVWGGYHALLFLPLIVLGKNRKYTDIVATRVQADGKIKKRLFPSIKEIFQMAVTFGLVVIGWVIFRADSISEAYGYLKIMLHLEDSWKASYRFFLDTDVSVVSSYMIVLALIIEWLQRDKTHGLEISAMPMFLRWIMYSVIVFVIYIGLIFGSQAETFIYFQF